MAKRTRHGTADSGCGCRPSTVRCLCKLRTLSVSGTNAGGGIGHDVERVTDNNFGSWKRRFAQLEGSGHATNLWGGVPPRAYRDCGCRAQRRTGHEGSKLRFRVLDSGAALARGRRLYLQERADPHRARAPALRAN